MAPRTTKSPRRQPQQRSTAQSCRRGCGSITAATPTGRAGSPCPPSPSPPRVASLRRGQAAGCRVHLRRPPAVGGSRLSTRRTGTVTRIPSGSPRPALTRVARKRSRPQPRTPGRPSCRTGVLLGPVWIRLSVRSLLKLKGLTRPKACFSSPRRYVCALVDGSDGKQAHALWKH